MKKLLLTALIAVSLISSSFAAGEKAPVNKTIINNFRSDFKDVQDVKWTTGESFVTATFVSDNKGTQAFYDFSGNLLGSAHAVSIDHLPITAKRALAKKYKDYTIKEAIIFDKSDEQSYFVSLVNGKETIILQVLDGQVSVYKRMS